MLSPTLDVQRVSRRFGYVTVAELKRYCRASLRYMKRRRLNLPKSQAQAALILKDLKTCADDGLVCLSADKQHKLKRLCKPGDWDRKIWSSRSLANSARIFKTIKGMDGLDDAPPAFLERTIADLRGHPLGHELLSFAERHGITIRAAHVPICAEDIIDASGYFDPNTNVVTLAMRDACADTSAQRASYAAILAHELRHAWQRIHAPNIALLREITGRTAWHDFFVTRVTEADAATIELKINAELHHKFSLAAGLPWPIEPLIVADTALGLEDEMDDRLPLPMHGTHADLADVFAGALKRQAFYESYPLDISETPGFATGWAEFTRDITRLEREFLFAMTRYMDGSASYLDRQLVTYREATRNLRTLHLA